METLGLLPTPRADKTTSEKKESWERRHGDGKVATPPLELAISLLADSPVSLFPKPDEERERRMTASSGRRCFELYGNFLHYGSLLKMFVEFLLSTEGWYSSKCVLIWKERGMTSKRFLFQLYPSMRHTEETGCGLLPTAQASDPTTGSVIGKNDTFRMTKGLPRKVNQNGKDGSVGLGRIIQLLKTPSASEAEGGWKIADKYWNAKAPKFKTRDQVGRKTGLKLQPNFVEWMMGYPQGWTDLNSPLQPIEEKDSKASGTA